MKKLLSYLRNGALLTTVLVASGSAAYAATPQIVGWSQEEGELLGVNQSGFKIGYDEKVVLDTYWTLLKGDNVVLTGTQRYAGELARQEVQIDFKNAKLADKVAEGVVNVGDEVTLRIDAVEYVASNETVKADLGVSKKYILTDLPVPTMYSPSTSVVPGSAAGEIKASSAFYIYFSSPVLSANVEVIQDGTVMGEYVIPTTSKDGKAATTVSLAKDGPVDAFLKAMNIQPGEFVVKVTGVTYGDAENPTEAKNVGTLGTVRWIYKGTPAQVVSESVFKDETILSYWPEDAEDGVLTLTFDRPLKEGAVGRLVYGSTEGNGPGGEMRVIPQLSADGYTLTADLRGVARSSEILAPGAKWVDDMGNPVDPPVTIGFEIQNLYTTDGSAIEYRAWDLEHTISTTLSGRYQRIFHYLDLTQETPVIKKVEFDNGKATLSMSNLQALKEANVIFKKNGKTYKSPANISSSFITCDIPEGLDVTDTTGLSVGLSDMVFATEDGIDHKVAPFVFGSVEEVPECQSVNELLAVAPGTEVILNPVGGLKITYANEETGYFFAEDETAGLMLDPETLKGQGVEKGLVLNGTIKGVYKGAHIFCINLEESAFDVYFTEVEPLELGSTDGVQNDSNLFRLVKFVAGEEMTIVYNPDYEAIIINEILAGITMDESVPTEEIASVTGFLWDNSAGVMLLIPDASYIKIKLPSELTLGQLPLLERMEETDLVVENAKVNWISFGEDVYIEDATGATVLVNFVPEGLETGSTFTGKLHVTYNLNYCEVDMEKSEYTIGEKVDVTKGAEMTIEELRNPNNIGRLVTFTSANHEITIDEYEGYIDDLMFYDYSGELETLPTDKKVLSVTGLVVDTNVWLGGDPYYAIVLRGKADLVLDETTGVSLNLNDKNGALEIYNVNGVRVNAEKASDLKNGVYVINGQKVLIIKK